MPSDRFQHLSEAKREKIIAAAYEELSKVPYSELSINRIIRTAGIPRGSFYDYFEDKVDLLMYLMERFMGAVRATAIDSLRRNRGDVFAVMTDIYDCIMDYSLHSEHRAVCANVFRCLHPYSENTKHLLSVGNQKFEEMLELYQGDIRYRYTDTEDIRLIWETVTELMILSVAKVYGGKQEKEFARRQFMRQLELVRHGVMD